MIGSQRVGIPGPEGFWVELQDEPTYGQWSASKDVTDLMVHMIRDWNLVDDDGAKLAVSRANFELQVPFSIWRFVADRVNERIKGRSEEAEAPFETPSSPGSPLSRET